MLSDDIAGQGVMQYFTWNAWMMLVSAALAVGAYMSYQDTKFLDNVEASMDQLACYAPRLEDLLEVSNVSRSAALNMTHALMTTIAAQAPHALVTAGVDPADPLAKYFDV